MPNIVQKGYTEDPYLSGEPYTGGTIYHGVWSQVNRVINTTHHVKEQVSRRLDKVHRDQEQIQRQLNKIHSVHEQIKRRIDTTHHLKEQVQKRVDTLHTTHGQIDRAIQTTHRVHEQTKRNTTHTHSFHEQIDRRTSSKNHKHEEIRRGNILFLTSETYLEQPYLEDPYLVFGFQGHMRSQVMRFLTKGHQVHEQVQRQLNKTHRFHEQIQRRLDKVHHIREQIQRFITKTHHVKEQVQRRIDTIHRLHEQIEQRIDTIHRIHEQIQRMNRTTVHSQITQVLYNTTNLRILLDFPSRGSSGTNWTANSTEVGDFSVNNVNTDIVEQVWRSASGTKTGLLLTCDTQVTQGVFVDTLAFLGHNLTTSASIVWEASNDPGFSTIGFTQVLTSTKTNIYYIAPTLPTDAFRYHRFSIDDNTNSASYLQIGTIVFGSSIIFQGECFVDQVKRQTVHFADKIATEAFTNVSNDRAIKIAVSLDFRNLNFLKGNYTKIRDVFEIARTSLKCLWIPTPQYVSRYAAFAKLSELPEETHNDLGSEADYVSFSIRVDESL